MSGPESGKYLIQLAEGRRPLIGVDSGPAPVKPIITDANEVVWSIDKLTHGLYTLTLDEGVPVYIQEDQGELVGTDEPPSFHWTIRGHEGEGTYVIEKRGITPTRAWTVEHPQHKKSRVTLDLIGIPRPNQRWRFISAKH